jgi:hypothetical protein
MVLGFPPSAPWPPPGWRVSLSRVFAAAAMSCALAGAAHAGVGQAGPRPAGDHDDVHAIKASYLYKLTPFVDWPSGSFGESTSPFRLCVAGHDPFGGVLDHAMRGRRVGDHPVMVVRLPMVTKGAGCHMLFLSASRTQTPRQMLAMVAGEPVLTVADETLEAPDAMVQFVTLEGRVRFEIRADAAQAGGLVLSSKLQALAAPPRDGGK